MADRLRAGSKVPDHDEIDARLAAIRQGREVEEHDIAQRLERAADHVLDRLRPPDAGLAYEGSGHDRDRPQDLAARMREAWALRDARSDIGDQRSEISEKTSDKPATPQSLADRLRAGSKALDHDEIAARLAAIRQGREVGKEHVAEEAERLHDNELEQEREAEVRRERGPGHEL